jgi:hypothetical protein
VAVLAGLWQFGIGSEKQSKIFKILIPRYKGYNCGSTSGSDWVGVGSFDSLDQRGSNGGSFIAWLWLWQWPE